MKKKALNIYHVMNALHLLFYAFLAIQILNLGDFRSLLQGEFRTALFIYIGIILALRIYAKNISNETKNPIQTVTAAKYLHFGAIVLFVLGAIGSININPDLVYLVFLSFPLDLTAFILAFKGSQDEKTIHEDLLDDFDLEE